MTRRNVQIEFQREQPIESPQEFSAPQMGARGVWFLWALLLVGLTLVAYLPSIRVSWISQRPMLLGMLFGIASLIVYLRFCGIDPEPIEPRPQWLRLPARRSVLYALALTLFLAAVLSAPPFAVLPLIVLAIIWWKR